MPGKGRLSGADVQQQEQSRNGGALSEESADPSDRRADYRVSQPASAGISAPRAADCGH